MHEDAHQGIRNRSTRIQDCVVPAMRMLHCPRPPTHTGRQETPASRLRSGRPPRKLPPASRSQTGVRMPAAAGCGCRRVARPFAPGQRGAAMSPAVRMAERESEKGTAVVLNQHGISLNPIGRQITHLETAVAVACASCYAVGLTRRVGSDVGNGDCNADTRSPPEPARRPAVSDPPPLPSLRSKYVCEAVRQSAAAFAWVKRGLRIINISPPAAAARQPCAHDRAQWINQLPLPGCKPTCVCSKLLRLRVLFASRPGLTLGTRPASYRCPS